jgi:hypothetical protein
MGIGDRAYMRNQRLAREPISVTAWVVGVLIASFILGLIQESAGANFLGWAMLGERAPMLWQWLTHGLLHDGFWHLLGNCLILWWTGAIVEREQGPRALLAVLAAGTLFGALAWALTGLGGDRSGQLIGISAGVYALMLVALLDKLDHRSRCCCSSSCRSRSRSAGSSSSSRCSRSSAGLSPNCPVATPGRSGTPRGAIRSPTRPTSAACCSAGSPGVTSNGQMRAPATLRYRNRWKPKPRALLSRRPPRKTPQAVR